MSPFLKIDYIYEKTLTFFLKKIPLPFSQVQTKQEAKKLTSD